MKCSLTDVSRPIADELRYEFINLRDFCETSCEKAASLAEKLYHVLVSEGITPKFSEAVMANRGWPPTTKWFFLHFHALEDFIAFLDDVNAHDVIPDTTMDVCFDLPIGKNTLRITRNKYGWCVENQDYPYASRFRNPLLMNGVVLETPGSLWRRMDDLWNEGAEGMTKEAMQDVLNEVGNWIFQTHRNTPKRWM